MKLIPRYLLCLVALLLLFSAYCKPGKSLDTDLKPIALPDIDSPVESPIDSRVGRSLLFADALHAINLCITNSVLVNLPDPHPSRYRLKIYHDQPASPRNFFNQSESFPPFAVQRSSTDLWGDVLRSPKYALQSSPLLNKSSSKNYLLPDINTSIIYKEKKERTGFGRGAAIGALVGAGVGGIVGFASGSGEGDFISPGAYLLGGMIIGAVVGVIIGGIIGAATKKRKVKR